MSAVTTVSGRPRRTGRWLVAAIVAIGLVALLVRALGGSGDQPPSPRVVTPSPTAMPDRRSAAGAGVRYAQELAVAGVRRPAVYGRRLRQIAAPGAVGRVRAAFASGAEEVRALVGGELGLLRAAPIGYRIDSFDARWAKVTIWLVALAGGPALEPSAQWRLLTLDLRWTAAGWRVAGGSGARGHSPRSPLRRLVAEASSFEELRHVP